MSDAPIGATRPGATIPGTAEATQERGSARSRLVGARTGILADAIVAIVQLAQRIRARFAGVARWALGVVTPLGWVVLTAIPVAFGLGYGFAISELVVVGWALLALALIAVLYLVGRIAYDVTLDLAHPRVVVGESAEGQVLVRNPRPIAVLGTTLEVPVGSQVTKLAVPALRGHGETVQTFAVPTLRRGVVEIGPVRTVRADPIGLVRRELVWSGTARLTVHPRTIAAPSTSTGLIHDLEGQTTRELTASDVAFHALREYQRGDERRYIHWKSSAKTGVYMVRQFEQTRRSHLVVALSLAPGDYASDEEFELAVGAAASLGVRAIRDARSVSVVTSAVTPEFAKRVVHSVRTLATYRPERLLDDLAVVDRSDGAIAVHDVARVIADRIASVSVAFLVCGSRANTSRLRGAVASFPEDVSVVAILCDPEAEPGLRRVAGLSILSIGFLDDLRTALLRSGAA